MPSRFLPLCFQLFRASSQDISERAWSNWGYFGFLLLARIPWCLKVTISPGLRFHSSDELGVTGAARNRMPLGLHLCVISCYMTYKRGKYSQLAFPLIRAHNLHKPRFSRFEFLVKPIRKRELLLWAKPVPDTWGSPLWCPNDTQQKDF